MPCNDLTDYIWRVCTDANTKYTKNATEIVVVAEYRGGNNTTYDYTMYLQRWDNSKKKWVNEGSQSGWLRYRTPEKKFPLAGKKAGKYRIKFAYKNRSTGADGEVYTYSFLVER